MTANEHKYDGRSVTARRLLVGAIAAAALLRFVMLGQKPLWCDELATLQRLSLSFAEHLRAMRGNHPLFELLLRFWMPPEGYDAWMRIPSAAFGVAAVWLTWLLLKQGGVRLGLAGAWMMALSPLHVMYSRIARPYSLACLLALAGNLALMAAVRRRRFRDFACYVICTTLLIYTNLLASALWVGQALFLAWFYRRRIRKLGAWAAAFCLIGVLLMPWMLFSFRGAVTWGSETVYTAQQYGRIAKGCYLALTLSLGETVNPLNPPVVIAGLVGFGGAILAGVIATLRRRRAFGWFLLIQVATAFVIALFFSAAAPKHFTGLLPAWLGLAAMGLIAARRRSTALAAAILIAATTGASLFNYFTDRQFADADMVTPWKEIATVVEREENETDALLIGYHQDRGVYDIFQRYYRGRLRPQWLKFADWREELAAEAARGGTVWLLLHDTDPWAEIEAWMNERGWNVGLTAFQEEEHTLQRLRERRWGSQDLITPLYRLYRITAPGERK